MVPIASFSQEETLPDSLHLPEVDYNGALLPYRPLRYNYIGGPWGWNLHEGFNASLDLSAFTSFGKNHFSGTAERISAMYAVALNNHLSLAVGGYFTNMNTNRGAFRSARLSAILDYRFNDHWEAYIYAQKNLLHSGLDNRFAPWYGMNAYDYYGNMCDRIGLGVRYNFNESTYVEVQFDFARMPYSVPQPPPTTKQSGDTMNRNIEKSNPLPTQGTSTRKF